MAKLGFLHDIGRCIGCKACQVACKDANGLDSGEFFRRVDRVEYAGKTVFYSGACNHCKRPLCVQGCPTGAMYIADDETVQHNAGLCIGCGACTWNCPYGAPVFSKTKGISQKCDACAKLRAIGQEPACVQACISRCLRYGPIEEKSESPSFLPPVTLSEPSLKIIDVRQQATRTDDGVTGLPASGFPQQHEVISQTPLFSTERTAFSKDTEEHFVIIGNGVAGVSAAAALRARNRTCVITIAGDEGVSPYSRPMITKAPLRGFTPSAFTMVDGGWVQRNRIEIINGGAARRIEPSEKAVLLEDGRTLGYDRLIISTGAQSFIPPVPGRENSGVFSIRTLKDIAAIRLALTRARSAVFIGGGVIGLEAVWELKKTGCRLTVLEAAPTLMCRQLDEQSARLLQEQIQKAGIEVHTGIQLERITGEGSVSGVQLADGTVFEADMVVFCCGIASNTRLAAEAGVRVNRGIVVNEMMETTVPGVYACGDCAEYEGIVFGTWPHAAEQGRIAGANAAGEGLPYPRISASLLFHGIGTCLYAQGDTGKNPALQYETVVGAGPLSPQTFFVNQPRHSATAYEKYFFAGDRLTGGVLIGDLSKMTRLQEGMKQRMQREEFLRMMAD